MWHSEWGLLLCTAGIARNPWGVTKGKQFTKADTEQTYSVRTSTILTYVMTGAITYTHTQTRGRLDSQKERQQMRINGIAIPGAFSQTKESSTLRWREEEEILVSKVWGWEVWCSAIWWVQCRARGKWDCESVMMLFCASK